MDLLNYCLKGYHDREAFVLENKIVSFGFNNLKTTLVFEQEEDSEQLRVVRED